MICSSCQQHIPDNAKYCLNCGRPIYLNNDLPLRILLLPSKIVRFFLFILGTIMFIGCLSSMYILFYVMPMNRNMNTDLKNLIINNTIIALSEFFCLMGSFLMLKFSVKGCGYLEIRTKGILMDTFWNRGFIPWDNLNKVSKINNCLAICVNDPEKFIESKTAIIEEIDMQNMSMYQSIFGIFGIIGKIFSFLGVPDMTNELCIMKKNKDDIGFHIVIPSYCLNNPKKAIELIQQYHKISHK